ncbi:hypothetical protein AWW68_11480 [Roseivirga spongicola]|uniref:Uncharacterized protein n=1 Tax=Roseivirga spongicola TaxID=333140 RepID=A0A150X3N6_9BACT|nr:hypothetical protein AWW68_11480 [Roseivirga spongicola]
MGQLKGKCPQSLLMSNGIQKLITIRVFHEDSDDCSRTSSESLSGDSEGDGIHYKVCGHHHCEEKKPHM